MKFDLDPQIFDRICVTRQLAYQLAQKVMFQLWLKNLLLKNLQILLFDIQLQCSQSFHSQMRYVYWSKEEESALMKSVERSIRQDGRVDWNTVARYMQSRGR